MFRFVLGSNFVRTGWLAASAFPQLYRDSFPEPREQLMTKQSIVKEQSYFGEKQISPSSGALCVAFADWWIRLGTSDKWKEPSA